ncbi:MAG: hypothetical protein A2Y62_00825 [Candidatus Fischerbacteria bacterium RBG_13_37_8]|uniref:HTH merR-type domain-containing protein n=1 Tax=Candidatus Fischerbacteria bacterium RBG_13_37_8 TaxID=1817863 RepID=A0A1F5VLU3_9BACT|nr:MAG: hypothetical protein A2Y62_00825 [Candidatus Fischerbacteria bacterium RBG_13_37_8]
MYNIDYLAKTTGSIRRTIRYYIQRGLLKPPLSGGRGAYYTDEHLEQLKKILQWTEQGVPLIHIKEMLEGKAIPVSIDREEEVLTTIWEKFNITPGIELLFAQNKLDSRELKQIQDFIINLKKGGRQVNKHD